MAGMKAITMKREAAIDVIKGLQPVRDMFVVGSDERNAIQKAINFLMCEHGITMEEVAVPFKTGLEVDMNGLNTDPLYGTRIFHDKSNEFNHSDEEFDEVLEDGLRLNDMVQQLKKQISIQEQDNLALIERNEQLEAENSKLKAMLAKAHVDFLKQEDASGSDMVDQLPYYKQHAMEGSDEMV